MFRFDFDIGGEETYPAQDELSAGTPPEPPLLDLDKRPLIEHQLSDMLGNLPDDISYSSVRAGELCIPRRELFDVRMQLITLEAQTDKEERSKEDLNQNQAAIEFVSRPSDLVPRVYEGGLKTWECSLDLANYVVDPQFEISDLRGKMIIELGCGTAMPTLSIIQKLLDRPPPADSDPKTIIHVQDYNASVLEYVTLPNMILVWLFSKAGEQFRATLPPTSPKPPHSSLPDVSELTLNAILEEEEDENGLLNPPYDPRSQGQPSPRTIDPTVPGDITLSEELRSVFLDSLREHKIDIRFFSGPWDKFHPQAILSDTLSYDLVLTSETIYQPTSLGSLVRLLRDAVGTGDHTICLVAAKLVYFGVGGGIKEFQRSLAIDDIKGTTENVWDFVEGVGRSILRSLHYLETSLKSQGDTEPNPTPTTIADFQNKYIKQRTDAHAKRVAAHQLAAAPLVIRDVENTMTEVWKMLPQGFGGVIEPVTQEDVNQPQASTG
ncbi:hypothetical protein FRC12_007997 [Ceratobasidium sp. 428]|nr:hypothetical protein FRC12_007997 [Ceratobasidium sp. 428]